MTERPFRFGIVAGHAPDLHSWTTLARRVEDLGYDTLLATDPLLDLDPLTVLSAAAAATTTLHVGTFVAVDTFRDRRMLAWQAQSLHALTGGRFELGLGTGRPDSAERIERLGGHAGTASERVDHLAETLAFLRQESQRPRILVAAAGPRMLRLAAQYADTVTMAWSPRTTPVEAKPIVDRLREAAGERWGELEVAINLVSVGDRPAPWLERFTGVAAEELAATGAMTVLPGTPQHGADTLRRWRDEFGVSYVTINSSFCEEFAPIVDKLRSA
jgi:probable F420-dependent oxidoreductase